jgi:hypothetical protein
MTEPNLEADNKILTTWVIGLVTGCDACTEEAKAWVESLDEIHTEYQAEQT